MDGINSIKAWAIDMATIKTQRNSGERTVNKKLDDANNIAPAVLTCIPGTIPVIVPINMPIKQAITSSIIAINCINYNLSFVEIIFNYYVCVAKLKSFELIESVNY